MSEVNESNAEVQADAGVEYFDLGGDASAETTITQEPTVESKTIEPTESVQEVVATPQTAEDLGLSPFDGDPSPQVARPESKPAKEDESRYEYWQSKHDSVVGEKDSMQKQLDELQTVAPIARYIMENPEAILNKVEESLSSGDPQVAAPQGRPEVESLKKPERPTKPSNYDSIEAYSDPESASFKFREAKEDFNDSMLEYYEEQETGRQKVAARQQQEASAQAQLRTYQDQLVSQYGYTPEKAGQFLNYYMSADSLSLDNLVKLDKIRNAPSREQIEAKQKAESMKANQRRLEVPPPAGVVTSQGATSLSDEDMFNLGLMRNKR